MREAHITIALLCLFTASSHARNCNVLLRPNYANTMRRPAASVACVRREDRQAEKLCCYNASTNLRDCRHFCITNYCSLGQAPQHGRGRIAPTLLALDCDAQA